MSDLVYVNAYTITKIFVIARTVDNTILLDNNISNIKLNILGLVCVYAYTITKMFFIART
jgi:hypothetical protein